MSEHNSTASQPEVRIGQVWADNDRRSAGRYVRVAAIEPAEQARDHVRGIPAKAVVVQVDSRGRVVGKEKRTRIRLDRFKPTSTGYRLVEDAEGGAR